MNSSLTELERLFKALADSTRLRILGVLLGGEVCVCHIHDSLRVPQPKASRHLAYLRRAGLVATRRDGVWIHYRLAATSDPALAAIRESLARTLRRADGVRLDAARLRACCVTSRSPAPKSRPSPRRRPGSRRSRARRSTSTHNLCG